MTFRNSTTDTAGPSDVASVAAKSDRLGTTIVAALAPLKGKVWAAERTAGVWRCNESESGSASWPDARGAAYWAGILDACLASDDPWAVLEQPSGGACVVVASDVATLVRVVICVFEQRPPPDVATLAPLIERLVREATRLDAYEAWAELTRDVAIVCDETMCVTTASPLAIRMFGSERDPHGRRLADLIPGWHLARLEPGEIARGHHAALNLGWSFQALPSATAAEQRFLLRFRTPSAARLQQQHQVAFLQALRHDVRSPLTALRGLVAVLIDEPSMPLEERGQLLELLRVEAERIVNFVEDYLVAMRLRIEPRPQQPRSCDMRGALTQYFSELAPHAVTRRIHFEHRLEDCWVEADAPLLDAFVRNVIGAVFRMADAGSTIRVELRPDQLSIRGEGPGLFHQLLDRPFTSLARSTSSGKRTPGAALGFFLVKKIADAHGWRIDFGLEQGIFNATVTWKPAIV